MKADLKYSMSSFLMYRAVVDRGICFSESHIPQIKEFSENRKPIYNSNELLEHLKEKISEKTQGKKCALALSGGIDSAILLQLMPEDTIVYTFKCIVPGIEVTDESIQAKKYVEYAKPGIEHKIIPIYWEDMERLSYEIMQYQGEPIHSIEVQIYKAALQAKADGCDIFVFGELADCIYGGHSQVLSRDWAFGEFVNRWSFVLPYMVLRDPVMILDPYREFERDGYVDVASFLTHFQAKLSFNDYMNACDLAGIEFFSPYADTIMGDSLDLSRIRQGENKYLVREVFSELYPEFVIPTKTPMPRPMNEWFVDWTGPIRPEFLPHCTDNMTGEQKWLVWALERFLDIID